MLDTFGRLLGMLSPRLLDGLGRALSRVDALTRARRRIVERNIAACFPQLSGPEQVQLVRRTMASNMTGGLETLCAWFSRRPLRARLARIEGVPLVQDLLRSGRGVMLVGAHYDGIEMAIRLVSELFPGQVILLKRSYNDPCIERHVDRGRRRYLRTTVDKKDMAGFSAQVKAGGLGIYVPDQDASRRNAFVPFFGQQASTLAVIPGVLDRAGAVGLLMWCSRQPDGRYVLTIREPPAGFFDGEGADVAARYMRWIEDRLADSPEQYLWMHRRFKTRPAGEPPLY